MEGSPDQPPTHSDLRSGVKRPEGIAFGTYRLVRKIAVGGMAEVYLALGFGQFGFQRRIVVKVLLPRLARHERFVEMFVQEAVLAADFRHPGTVTVFDLGKVGELYYIAMEFVDGVDLMRLVRRCRQTRSPLPLDLVLSVCRKVADTLHAVHGAKDPDGNPLKIVHLDVTPQNLMIGFDGQVKLVDFGVAQALLAEAKAIQALQGKGPYMAPEQWSGDPVDRRADIFALGTVLYELTVGKRLFRRKTPAETRKAILQGEVPRPTWVRSGFLPDLEEVLLRSLAVDPRDRFQDARSLRQAIDAVQQIHGLNRPQEKTAEWMQELFGGLSRDDLWPKLDLNAPGQLSEAQQAMRRSAINIPAFQFNGEFDPDQESETSPAILTSDLVPEDMEPAPPASVDQENPPKPRSPTLLLAVLLMVAGGALGSLVTWLLVSR
jgi:serine/threonine protein kinase